MVRTSTIAAIEKARSTTAGDEPAPRIVLSGEPGTGKSLGLLHTVHSCHAAGWCVAYVADAPEWTELRQSIFKSVYKENRVDQYAAAEQFLRDFVQWNEQILGAHSLSEQYAMRIGVKEVDVDGFTLLQLAQKGARRKLDSTIIFFFLRQWSSPVFNWPSRSSHTLPHCGRDRAGTSLAPTLTWASGSGLSSPVYPSREMPCW